MFQFSASFSTLRRRSISALPFVLIALTAVVPSSATVITGHLGIAAGAGGSVTVTNSTITFGNGLFSVGGTPPNTGSFAAPFDFTSLTGTILNLNSAPGNQPTGTTFSLLNFLTFTNDPTTFELTDILPGTYSSVDCNNPVRAANQNCTPLLPSGFGVSPFNLSNISAVSSTASFSVKGKVKNGSDVTFFTGTFSNTFNGTTTNPQAFQDILAVLNGPAGRVSSTYSATFDVAAVPEPATFALVGLTLGGAAVLRRRRRA